MVLLMRLTVGNKKKQNDCKRKKWRPQRLAFFLSLLFSFVGLPLGQELFYFLRVWVQPEWHPGKGREEGMGRGKTISQSPPARRASGHVDGGVEVRLMVEAGSSAAHALR